MNKNIVIGLVVVIAVVVGGWLVWGDKMGGSVTPNEPFTATGSLDELLARGGNYKCTFTHESAAASSKGTVYIAGEGKKIRGDFSSLVPVINTDVASHMIRDGEWVYTWSEMMPQGFKAKAVEGQGSKEAALSGQGFDANQSYNYNCEPWVVEVSQFTVPTNITFTELAN